MSLRKAIADWCRQVADWFAPLPPPPPLAPPPVSPYWQLTRTLVLEAEKLGASGEYKRHQVYSKLQKAFPEALKRDLAYEIEQVIQDEL